MIIKSDRRIMLDETQSIPLEVDDLRAAYLLVGEGCPIDTARLAELNITVVDGMLVLPDSAPENVEDDLKDLTFAALKPIAAELGVPVKVGMSAHKLREAIRAKRAEPPVS